MHGNESRSYLSRVNRYSEAEKDTVLSPIDVPGANFRDICSAIRHCHNYLLFAGEDCEKTRLRLRLRLVLNPNPNPNPNWTRRNQLGSKHLPAGIPRSASKAKAQAQGWRRLMHARTESAGETRTKWALPWECHR